MKWFLKRILIAFLVLAVIVVAGGAWLWRQSRVAPAWYAPPDPTNQEVVALAEKVEYGIVETFHKLRPAGEPWTVRIREEQINAWLSARMPEWIAHDETLAWPSELSVPQVHIGPEGLDLAVEFSAGDRTHVVVTRVDPRIEGGHIHLEMDRVGVGRVAVPGAPATKMMEILDRLAPGGVIDGAVGEQIVGLFQSGDGAGDGAARFDLADGRRVELLGLALTEGAMDITSRTLVAEGQE